MQFVRKEEGAEHPNEKKKQRVIQWDEVTIAEHDKERGSRQKIDEAPTPFRYMSESDQSEAESGSDGEFLSRRRRSSSADQSHTNARTNSNSTSGIRDSWEAFTAKLHYEKHLQDLADSEHAVDETTSFGEIPSTSPHALRPAMKHTHPSFQLGSTNGMSSPVKRSSDHKRAHKSVHIKPNEVIFKNSLEGRECESGGNSGASTPANEILPQTPDSECEHQRRDKAFLDKRAGHYNEFKILQAMRAKIGMDEDEDEGEDEQDDREDHSDGNLSFDQNI